METTLIIRTVIECSIGLLLCVGFIFEDKVAQWEEDLFSKITRKEVNK